MENKKKETNEENKINFIIDRTYPSLNEYILKCRESKYKGNEFKKNDEIWTSFYIMSKKIKTVPEEWYPLRISFRFYEKNTKRDIDNVMGYAHKIILDALQKTIIKQDNWRGIREIRDEFYIDKKFPRIEIEIKPFNKINE